MEHGSGNDNTDARTGAAEGCGPEGSNGLSRRAFSRTSLAGAGVLLTLGNSAAWGRGKDKGGDSKKGVKKGKKGDKGKKVCVSTMILESFQTASHFDHHADDKKFMKYLKYVDINMDPLPGYETWINPKNSRETCIGPIGSSPY